ncbi:hypothetical protein SDJN03_16027, partial [Cucurbita argyrosperma subsp. sororia]
MLLAAFVALFLIVSTSSVLLAPSIAAEDFRPAAAEFQKLSGVEAHLKNINKPSSPDGDLIDCVLSHLQPAFDHYKLKQQLPLDPPDRPKGYNSSADSLAASFQLWRQSGESCPEGTIPIRRTTEQDILRASSVQRFGKKPLKSVRRDSSGSGHEHAVVFVNGEQYYGARANINVWAPHVSPELYGDNYPRFFTYWTTDAYRETGCYNLLCSGFVQTNNKIAIGAAISPTSYYNGRQFDMGLMIWKTCNFEDIEVYELSLIKSRSRVLTNGSSMQDPRHGNWWLEFGQGVLVGYWPAYLFSHLGSHASMIQFGGEVVNTRSTGFHTSTQMGSGHFAEEGYGKASYFRNLQIIDWDNSLLPVSNLRLLADHPNCYDIRQGKKQALGHLFLLWRSR